MLYVFFFFSHYKFLYVLINIKQMLEELDIADLTNSGVYIAGFTDSSIQRKTSIWDVFVNGIYINYKV